MRADLVVARTAVAHAAWRGADTVAEDDIRVAAELALPHRRRRDPFDDPGLDPDHLDQALEQAREHADAPPDPDPDPDGDPPGGGAPASGDGVTPGGTAAETPAQSPRTRPSAPPSPVFRTRALVVPGVGEGAPGRRSRARNRTGTVISPTPRPDEGHGLHLFGTLLAAAGRQTGSGRPRLAPEDVHYAVREGREGNLVIFVVDASGSMAARDRMSAVAGAALSLLRDAYQRRDKVAVITFRGRDAQLLLPPTSSVHIAGRRLARFDTGGKTPLAEGLLHHRDGARHAGRDHEEVGVERARGVAAELVRDAGGVELGGEAVVACAALRQEDGGAVAGEQPRRGQPAPRPADDGDALAGDLGGVHGDRRLSAFS